jgi:hypothetical protein
MAMITISDSQPAIQAAAREREWTGMAGVCMAAG